MSFDPDDHRLTAYALGELDPADRDAIEVLLHSDPDCLAFVQGIEATARLLIEELRNETSVVTGLDPSRREMIEKRLAKPALAIAESGPKKTPVWLQVFALAMAASIIGIAVGSILPAFQPARKATRNPTELALAEMKSVPAVPPAAEPMRNDHAATHVVSADAYGESSDAVSAQPKLRAAQSTPSVAPLSQTEVKMASAAQAGTKVSGVDSLGTNLAMRESSPSVLAANAPIAPEAEKLHRAVTKPDLGRSGEGVVYTRELMAKTESNPSVTGFGTNNRFGYSQPQKPGEQPSGSSNKGMSGGMGGIGGGMGGGLGMSPTQKATRSIEPSNKPAAVVLRTFERGGAVKSEVPLVPQNRGFKSAKLSETGLMPADNSLALRSEVKPGQAPSRDEIQGLGRSSPAKKMLGDLKPNTQMRRSGQPEGEAARKLDYDNFAAISNAPPAALPAVILSDGLEKVSSGPAAPAPSDSSKPASESRMSIHGRQVMVKTGDPASQESLASGRDKSSQVVTDTKGGDQNGKSNSKEALATFSKDQNQVLYYAPTQKNQDGQKGSATVQAEAKGDVAGPQVAFNDNNEVNQQRVAAIQVAVDTKQAELQQLQEQVEITRRRMSDDKARVDREAYARVYDNPFTNVVPGIQLSTFAVDVDTASYANIRRFITQGQIPPVDAVRIEEMVNYFSYDDPAPTGNDPFSVNVEIAACPWDGSHRLARIGLKGKTIPKDKRPLSNLVFLIDVSGSMADLNKLPFLKAGMKLLVEQLTENDRVAIVTYSNEIRVVLASTPCHNKAPIFAALDGLKAEGGTNGGAGVQKAYEEAQTNFIKGGTNRVILATDGDFNVGLSKEELLATSEQRAKGGIFLSVLGFGQGNIQEDFMEQLADKGNGNYSYIDNIDEARKVLVRQMSGTLDVIAKDVKVQVEFNPDKVSSYRLIGYENRVMANEDFRNDKKDAGEIGAGHSVTALYELVPNATVIKLVETDRPLKYNRAIRARNNAVVATKSKDAADELNPETLTVYLRYKQPDGDKATEINKGITDDGRDFGKASTNLKFASAVAGYGMLLRESPHKGSISLPAVIEIASSALGADPAGDRKEFVEIVKKTESIVGVSRSQ